MSSQARSGKGKAHEYNRMPAATVCRRRGESAPAGAARTPGVRAPVSRMRESSARVPAVRPDDVVAPIAAITLRPVAAAPGRRRRRRRRHASGRGPRTGPIDEQFQRQRQVCLGDLEKRGGERCAARRMAGDARRACVQGRDRRMAGDAGPAPVRRPGMAADAGPEQRDRARRRRVAARRLPARGTPQPSESPDAWASTRAHTALATQILPDENDYLAGEKDEIGRQIGGNERELFVSCAPAEALQQQFDHLHPEFIAVHDIATASSRKLLAGIAAASGRAVQKLVIRRQGYGTALATLEFVELPTTDNQSLRLYTTEADADTRVAPRAGQDAARLQPARRHHGRRAAGPRDRRGAEAAARRHPRRPVAEPQPAAAAAGLGQHPGHARPRPRPRHRRRRAHDAAGRAPGRCLGLHHRHLEPAARAGARPTAAPCPSSAPSSRRRTSRASAPLAPVMGGIPSGDTLPMEDAAADHPDDAADAGDRDRRLQRRRRPRR